MSLDLMLSSNVKFNNWFDSKSLSHLSQNNDRTGLTWPIETGCLLSFQLLSQQLKMVGYGPIAVTPFELKLTSFCLVLIPLRTQNYKSCEIVPKIMAPAVLKQDW